ncbi:hypothetical protein [Pseudonocardia sp. GCM10023141]|uniref:hypothetical protein n=1 Tax=Pseudonocardia sp. GCM10023141 TaxID=3252653 RepID=UPI0036195269
MNSTTNNGSTAAAVYVIEPIEETDMVRQAGRYAVELTAVAVAFAAVLGITVSIAVSGGFPEVAAPVWWVATGVLGVSLWDGLGSAVGAWLHRAHLRRCEDCRLYAVAVDVMDRAMGGQR